MGVTPGAELRTLSEKAGTRDNSGSILKLDLAHQLLKDAQAQAANAARLVDVTARFHIARVLTVLNPPAARPALLQALPDLGKLRLSRFDRASLDDQSPLFIAAIAPDLLPALAPREQGVPDSGFRLFRVVLDHRHHSGAFNLFMSYPAIRPFPHAAVGMLLHALDNESDKLALLRRSLKTWRTEPASPFRPVRQDNYRHVSHNFVGTGVSCPKRKRLRSPAISPPPYCSRGTC